MSQDVGELKKMKFTAWFSCSLAAILCGLSAVALAPKAESSEKGRFTLVYNVNNSGYIDVCGCKHKEVRQGSLTRRSSFLKQLRSTDRKILLLDGGSALFKIGERVKEADKIEAVRKAKLIVEGYNRMGYDAMAVGAFDMAAGIETLRELEKDAKFKLLSANVVDKATGKLLFAPHTVLEVNGLRVGVIGLTLSTLTKVYLSKVAPDIRLADPFEAAQKSFEELRKETDMVIALSHLREETNFELVKKLKGLEIVVDPYIQYGNHHTWIKEEEWLSNREDTVFLRSDGQGARLGVVDIELLKPRQKLASGDRLDELNELVSFNEATSAEKEEYATLRGENLYRFARVSIEPHHGTDPEIDFLVEKWKKSVDPAKVAQAVNLSEKKDYTTHEKCKSCHEEQYAFWKTTSHSHALETLKKTEDQHRYDCVGCHSLGYGQAFLNTAEIGNYADVQCESCHGNKPQHMDAPKANAYGKVKRLTCIHCHNKEQTKKTFNYFRSKKQVACPLMAVR